MNSPQDWDIPLPTVPCTSPQSFEARAEIFIQSCRLTFFEVAVQVCMAMHITPETNRTVDIGTVRLEVMIVNWTIGISASCPVHSGVRVSLYFGLEHR